MILMYESPGCASCRKAKAWFEQNDLEYKAKNIETCHLREDELKYLFSLANSTEDLISKRSKVMASFKRRYHCDIEDLSFNELIRFIQNNPTALKRPIMTNGKVLMVGWDEDDITVFFPRERRSFYPGQINLN